MKQYIRKMSGKPDKVHYASSAATAPEDFFQNGPPPPSYDECLNMHGATPHQYAYSNTTQYQQQQSYFPPSPYAVPGPYQAPYGYANPFYQTHIQQQQNFCNSSATVTQAGNAKVAENVLYLAKGAKVRTTASGAISIPPPPPGCGPTPGQLAAMSGQPVMIKKQKKSFF